MQSLLIYYALSYAVAFALKLTFSSIKRKYGSLTNKSFKLIRSLLTVLQSVNLFTIMLVYSYSANDDGYIIYCILLMIFIDLLCVDSLLVFLLMRPLRIRVMFKVLCLKQAPNYDAAVR